MSAAERADRQRRADAASKPARLIDLQKLLAVPPLRNDGRGVDSLIPTRSSFDGELSCPACDCDPMAPHNGRGALCKPLDAS